MKLQIVDFHGFIKWLVTNEVIFVDPIYLKEVYGAVLPSKVQKEDSDKYLS